jgi:hypothetical protein
MSYLFGAGPTRRRGQAPEQAGKGQAAVTLDGDLGSGLTPPWRSLQTSSCSAGPRGPVDAVPCFGGEREETFMVIVELESLTTALHGAPWPGEVGGALRAVIQGLMNGHIGP